MMLDSSIGKILSTTKPVEPSIPGNSQGSKTKNDPAVSTPKSEAEVRIVFRFTVEEHIVYNGKIEQVKQLGNEDISRIVSRIAWDGAKDQKKPVFDKETIKNDEVLHLENKTEQTHLGNSNAASHPSGEESSGDVGFEEAAKEVPQGKSDIDCNHGDEEDCNIGLECSAPTDMDTTTANDSSLGITRLTPDSAEPLSPSFSYHICETNIQSDDPHNVQEKDNCQTLIEKEEMTHQEDKSPDIKVSSTANNSVNADADMSTDITGNRDIDNSVITDTVAAIAAAAAEESQMIVEALYDCVCNVDLESRKSDLASTVNNETTGPERTQHTRLDKLSDVTQNQHNELGTVVSKEVAKLDKKPLTEAANVPPNQDITQETIPNSEDSYLKNKGSFSNPACKDDLNLQTDTSKKPDLSLSNRRRNTCDSEPSTNRRIRRSGSKDLRATRISCTDRQRENNGRNDLINQEADNSGRHFVHQSKVFAKWSDNHFYPGTILKSARDRKFEIGFCDGARKDVVETDLIPLSNILCKQVRVSIAKDYCVNAIVHEQLSMNGQPMFDVSYQQNGLVRKCVPLRDIFLTADQGTSLISQQIRPDKNPDESMFAGVDLDNIVPNKRSRRFQEMEDLETPDGAGQTSTALQSSGRRKRGQYNTRTHNIGQTFIPASPHKDIITFVSLE